MIAIMPPGVVSHGRPAGLYVSPGHGWGACCFLSGYGSCVRPQNCLVGAVNLKDCPHHKECIKDRPGLSREQFDAEYNDYIDHDTGKRKLTCITREHIPENIQDSDRRKQWLGMEIYPLFGSFVLELPVVHYLLFGDGSLSPMDGYLVCFQFMLVCHASRKCNFHAETGGGHPMCIPKVVACLVPPATTCCGKDMRVHEEPAQVFGTNFVQSITIRSFHCDVCGAVHAPTGGEHFFFRKAKFKSQVLGTFEICFSWELLYALCDHIGNGYFFFSFFRARLLAYLRLNYTEQEMQAMQSLYPHLRDALMDFVDQMCLDYRGAFSCQCSKKHQHIVIDGITISCKRQRLFLVGPWLTTGQQGGGELVPARQGSAPADRLVIKDAGARDTLRDFTSAEGVPLPKLQELRHACDLPDAQPWRMALRTVLKPCPQGVAVENSDGKCVPETAFLPFLRSLSSNSPALAYLPLRDASVVMTWLDLARKSQTATSEHEARVMFESHLSQQHWGDMRDSIPGLAAVLFTVKELAITHARAELCVGLCDLVALTLQVCAMCVCMIRRKVPS